MIHTAVTAIRYHRVSLDFLRSSSISEVTSAGSSALNKVGAKSDETSGTWYEQDIAASGPIIDESYCHLETTVSTSDMTQNSENQVRRAFKTPPTTIVKSSQRSKASNYSILTGKLIDIKSTIQNMSPTSSDEINSTPTKASRNSNELSANIQTKALRELNKMNSEDSIVEREAFSDFPRKMVSSSGLDQDDIEALIRVYSRPLISNHHLLREGTQWIIDLLNKFNQAELSRAKRLTPKVAARTSLDVLCDSAFDCSLERHYNDLVESLMLEESLSEVCTCLEQALERCNAEMCKRWSLVLSSLPKVMNEIVDVLRGKYVHGMRAFWKGQTLLFKCRYLPS